MTEVARANPVERLRLELRTTFDYAEIYVQVLVIDPLTNRWLIETEQVFADLSSAGHYAEACMWAWITTGTMGLMAFLASESTSRMPEAP